MGYMSILTHEAEIKLANRIAQAIVHGPAPEPGIGARSDMVIARPKDSTNHFHFFRKTELGRRNLVTTFGSAVQIHEMFVQYGGATYVGVWEGEQNKIPGSIIAGMPLFLAADSDDIVAERLSPFWWIGLGAGTQSAYINFGRLGKKFQAGKMFCAGANNSGVDFDLTLWFSYSTG